MKINSVVQIRNKPNSRVRFGIPASLLLFGNEETNLAMLVVKLVSPSVFDVGLSTVCLLRKPGANSLNTVTHSMRLLCACQKIVSFREAAFQNQTSFTRHVSISVTSEIAAITQYTDACP